MTTTRVPVNPELLRWARERSGFSQADVATRFKKAQEWENGETLPTLKQVEAFARAVHVPVGYLFLSTPPRRNRSNTGFSHLCWTCCHTPQPESAGHNLHLPGATKLV